MGNSLHCEPLCSKDREALVDRTPIDNNTANTLEASGFAERRLSRRRELENDMHGSYSQTRKRPTLRERRQTYRHESEISES